MNWQAFLDWRIPLAILLWSVVVGIIVALIPPAVSVMREAWERIADWLDRTMRW